MNAIILQPISETLLTGTATSMLKANADNIAGWMSEAQRLALGANRRAHIAKSAARLTESVSTAR